MAAGIGWPKHASAPPPDTKSTWLIPAYRPGVPPNSTECGQISDALRPLGLKEGEAAIAGSGIPASHIKLIQEALQHLEPTSLVIFRPVSLEANGAILEGYLPKSGAIKGKSADWGAMAGLIPVDAALSKIGGNGDEVATMNQKNKAALDEGHLALQAQPLTLSYARLLELTEPARHATKPEALLQRIEQRDDGTLVLKSTSSDPWRQTFSFKCTPIANQPDQYAVSYQHETRDGAKWQPLQVFANSQGTPYTADYDVFAYAHKLNPIDMEPSEVPSRINWRGVTHRLINGPLLDAKKRRAAPNSIERQSRRDESVRQAINQSLIEQGQQPMVQHATEQENRAAPNCDPNLCLVTPQGVYLTQNWDEVQAMVHALKQADCEVVSNRSYAQHKIEWNPPQAYQAVLQSRHQATGDTAAAPQSADKVSDTEQTLINYFTAKLAAIQRLQGQTAQLDAPREPSALHAQTLAKRLLNTTVVNPLHDSLPSLRRPSTRLPPDALKDDILAQLKPTTMHGDGLRTLTNAEGLYASLMRHNRPDDAKVVLHEAQTFANKLGVARADSKPRPWSVA